MTRLIALYPAAWRARYEDEFLDLLAMRPPTIGDRIDILRGAVDAHLHPQVPAPERIPDRYGIGPLVGLASFVAAVVLAASGPLLVDEYGTYRDGSAGTPFFVLALVLLSVGLYRVVDRLPDDAAGPRAAGWTAIVAGPMWAFVPWILPLGLGLILGVIGLTVGARRAGIMPAWSVTFLVVMLAIPAGLLAAMPFLPLEVTRGPAVVAAVIVPLSILWLGLAGLLLRGFPQPVRR
jgi:hypothetical protein